ncbi:MAG TPA: ribonuclease J [Actinomycetota bacterium]|nr:ribonuclease J [Actinomycetota bacterium]
MSASARPWRTPVSSEDPTAAAQPAGSFGGSARVVFLGGVGEIGRNMACVELEGRILIVDVGLSFPHAEMPGIDLVLPDFQYVRERFDDVEAVVLTHGHQDHIGALPYLLREVPRPLPVFGTALTLALLEGQLEEHGVSDRADLREAVPGEATTIGPFSMRFIRVTHSIPDGMAVAIDTPFGSILHTGDFKIDQTPLDGRPTDLHALASEADRGVHLLLSDSTNAEESGYTESERTVGPVVADIVARAPRLVVVACFSSHIHRIQQVVNAARADERVVAFLGRSMHQSVEAARRLGLLHVPEEDVIPIEEVEHRDPSRVVVVSTGSQGEPYSALSLMAAREHKWVKLQEGDTVVLSSSLIPGNEPAIHRVIDGLYRTGADVFHMPTYPVHASGHGAADELRLMLSLVQPRWFIPVHGERRHLSHHAKIATEVGVAADHVLICEDGDVVEVGEVVRIAGEAPAGMTLVDGLGIGDVGQVVLRDRRKLASEGVVVAVLAVDAHKGDLVHGPYIINRGFVFDETSADILEQARERVMLSLRESAQAEVVDRSVLEQNVRRTLSRYFYEVTQRKPVILPVIMEV